MAWIGLKEMAAEVGVSKWTILRWVRKDAIPFYRLPNGQVKFDLKEFVKFLEDQVDKQKPRPNKKAESSSVVAEVDILKSQSCIR